MTNEILIIYFSLISLRDVIYAEFQRLFASAIEVMDCIWQHQPKSRSLLFAMIFGKYSLATTRIVCQFSTYFLCLQSIYERDDWRVVFGYRYAGAAQGEFFQGIIRWRRSQLRSRRAMLVNSFIIELL